MATDDLTAAIEQSIARADTLQPGPWIRNKYRGLGGGKFGCNPHVIQGDGFDVDGATGEIEQWICDARTQHPAYARALLRLLELEPCGHSENCRAIRTYYDDDRCECNYRHWQEAIAELRAGLGMER